MTALTCVLSTTGLTLQLNSILRRNPVTQLKLILELQACFHQMTGKERKIECLWNELKVTELLLRNVSFILRTSSYFCNKNLQTMLVAHNIYKIPTERKKGGEEKKHDRRIIQRLWRTKLGDQTVCATVIDVGGKS